MGVETRLVLYAADPAAATGAAARAFARIAELDSLLSDYRLDSELNRIRDAEGGAALPVSEDMVRVLATALEVSARSGGAFDVTTGPLTHLWRAARQTGVAPDPVLLERARRLVGWQKVQLDEEARTVALAVAGMRLDLGGVAKGYAVEAARAVLAAAGIDRCLIEMGGELALGRSPPDRAGWLVDVGAASGPARTLVLQNTFVATSGDAEQHVVIDGVRYSHVVEPSSGLGSTRGLTVTVIGPAGALADALATTATLLDEAARHRLLEAYPEYRILVRDSDD
jgi:thiamine biosynthesis lipoprotein